MQGIHDAQPSALTWVGGVDEVLLLRTLSWNILLE